jgi:exo-beta-1,3-glucanase (GH17 family)
LDLLVTAGISLIRLFDSSDKVALKTLEVIHANGMPIKVMLGVYVNSFEYETDPVARARAQAANQDEMARGVNLAKTYASEVVAVSVGNETMVTWSGHPISTVTMAGYIKTVRDQITQPVTTDDNYAFYAGNGRNASEQAAEVFSQIDFASIHTYPSLDAEYSNFSDNDPLPDWDWQQLDVSVPAQRATAMMDAAIAKAKRDYGMVRDYLNKNGRSGVPIVIGETGWQVGNTDKWFFKYMNAAANQKMYYSRLADWVLATRNGAGPKTIFYFEAFDEPWKQNDDNWGLFDVGRNARCTAQAMRPTATWAKAAGTCVDSSAKYFAFPVIETPDAGLNTVIFNDAYNQWRPGFRSDFYGGSSMQIDYPATGDSAPSDPGGKYLAIKTFAPAAYGWGVLWGFDAGTEVEPNKNKPYWNMSGYAGGSIRFSVKTLYEGALRIGISSDNALGKAGAEAFVLVSAGKYGYCRTNSWCDVVIPLSEFQNANPGLDLRLILTRFSVSDVWKGGAGAVLTGNTARSGMPEIRLDNIYWSK